MDKCLVVAFNDIVLTNQPIDILTDLVPWSTEEGDKRLFLHAENVAQ